MPRGSRSRTGRLGRDFWWYFTGQAVSQLGSAFTLFALPLLVFKLTHSPTNLALTTAANFVPYVLFGLILGAVIDRVDRKRMMVLVEIARAAVIAVLPCLTLAHHLRVEAIYAVAFVQSTLGILFDGGEFAAIPSLVAERELVTANGRIMATNSVGLVVGPALAGLLVTVMAVPDLLFVDAASFVVSALSLAAIRATFNRDLPPDQRERTGPRRSRLFADVGEGLRYVWSHPVLRSISIMMALINFVGVTQYTQLVLFAKRALAATDSQVALMYAAGAAGVVVVSLAAGTIRRRLSFAVTALGALVVSGLSVAAMGLVHSYAAAVVLWAAASGFGLLLNINTGALRQAIVPSHMFGRVITIAGVLAWSANPLGALAGAAVIRATGNVRVVYIGVGLVTAAIALAFSASPVRAGDRYLAEAAQARASESNEPRVLVR